MVMKCIVELSNIYMYYKWKFTTVIKCIEKMIHYEWKFSLQLIYLICQSATDSLSSWRQCAYFWNSLQKRTAPAPGVCTKRRSLVESLWLPSCKTWQSIKILINKHSSISKFGKPKMWMYRSRAFFVIYA